MSGNGPLSNPQGYKGLGKWGMDRSSPICHTFSVYSSLYMIQANKTEERKVQRHVHVETTSAVVCWNVSTTATESSAIVDVVASEQNDDDDDILFMNESAVEGEERRGKRGPAIERQETGRWGQRERVRRRVTVIDKSRQERFAYSPRLPARPPARPPTQCLRRLFQRQLGR